MIERLICVKLSFIVGEKEASPISLSGRSGLDGDTPLLNVCKLLILDGDGSRLGTIWEVKKKNMEAWKRAKEKGQWGFSC